MKIKYIKFSGGGQSWLNLRKSKFDFSLQNLEGGKAV